MCMSGCEDLVFGVCSRRFEPGSCGMWPWVWIWGQCWVQWDLNPGSVLCGQCDLNLGSILYVSVIVCQPRWYRCDTRAMEPCGPCIRVWDLGGVSFDNHRGIKMSTLHHVPYMAFVASNVHSDTPCSCMFPSCVLIWFLHCLCTKSHPLYHECEFKWEDWCVKVWLDVHMCGVNHGASYHDAHNLMTMMMMLVLMWNCGWCQWWLSLLWCLFGVGKLWPKCRGVLDVLKSSRLSWAMLVIMECVSYGVTTVLSCYR